MIHLHTYTPASLSQVVKYIWCMEVGDDGGTHHVEDIFPDGHQEIIFHLNNQARRTGQNQDWLQEPSAFLAGQNLSAYSLALEKGSVLYGIRFHPHTLSVIFDIPASVLTEKIIPLSDIPVFRMLESCLRENRQHTFKNLETAIGTLISKDRLATNKFGYIQFAVSEITRWKGNVRIDHLLRKTGISHRYFDTIFLETIGITPKTFCHIIRLNHLVNYKLNHPLKTLTECCYESGFFDQAHFIKTFKAFARQSPKLYFNRVNDINKSFSEI